MFSPLIYRELLAQARAKSPRRMRVYLSLGICAWMGLVWGAVTSFGSRPLASGAAVFLPVAWMLWIFCLFEGVRHASDALSREKREGTIGLLFLTRLTGREVVVGKIVSGFLASFFPILGLAPVLSIIVFWGGVMPIELVRVSVALLVSLLSSLSLSLLVSAHSLQARRAFAISAGVLFAWNLIASLWMRFPAGPDWPLPSPYSLFRLSFASGFMGHVSGFWFSLLGLLGLAFVMVTIAGVRLRQRWADGAEATTKPEKVSRRDRKIKERSYWLERSQPISWLLRRGGILRWLGGIGIAVVVLMLPMSVAAMASSPFGSGFSSLILQAIAIWAGVQFLCHSDRDNQLELLLTTPLPLPELVQQAHRFALRVGVVGGGVLASGAALKLIGLMIWALVSPEVLSKGPLSALLSSGPPGTTGGWDMLTPILYLLLQESLVVFANGVLFYASCWYALWRGAVSGSLPGALGRVFMVMVVGVVMGLGLLSVMLFGVVFGIIRSPGGNSVFALMLFMTIFSGAIKILCCLALANSARRRFQAILMSVRQAVGG